MFNRQEAFDTMVLGLNAQKALSLSDDGFSCRYRDNNGNKCAVGFLISDDEYTPEIEDLIASTLEVANLFGGLTRSDRSFLGDCQQLLHDQFRKTGWDAFAFQDAVAQAAAQYNLTNPLTTQGEEA